MDSSVLSAKELRRYNRQILLPGIGVNGQEKLKSTKVVVIGAGGLGCPVLQYLAASGVGKIGIVDYELVEEDCIQRQVLYGEKDLGKLKAIVAREKLQNHNPLVEYEVLNTQASPESLMEIVEGYDVVVDAVNHPDISIQINDVCILKNRPFVYGLVREYTGQVSVFNHLGGPSLRCAFPNGTELTGTNPVGGRGILGIAHGYIGILMANEVFKIALSDPGLLSGKMLRINLHDYGLEFVEVKRNEANFQIIDGGTG